MNAQLVYCSKCGQQLAPGTMICPVCGAPAPGTYFSAPSSAPAAPPARSSGRGARFWLGMIGVVGGGLLGVVMLVLVLLKGSGGQNTASIVTATSPEISTSAPVAQIVPQTEEPGTAVETALAQPTETPIPAVQDPVGGGTTYHDDLSRPDSGWLEQNEADFQVGYWQTMSYSIIMKGPSISTSVIPPYSFQSPIKNMIIKVRGKESPGADGGFGVRCHYQDNNNFYEVDFSRDYYGIRKTVNGKVTNLTEPFWQELLSPERDVDGYMLVILACVDGRIQLVTGDNETGQMIVSDEDLTEGDAAVLAWSGTNKLTDGNYAQAFFRDFSAELP